MKRSSRVTPSNTLFEERFPPEQKSPDTWTVNTDRTCGLKQVTTSIKTNFFQTPASLTGKVYSNKLQLQVQLRVLVVGGAYRSTGGAGGAFTINSKKGYHPFGWEQFYKWADTALLAPHCKWPPGNQTICSGTAKTFYQAALMHNLSSDGKCKETQSKFLQREDIAMIRVRTQFWRWISRLFQELFQTFSGLLPDLTFVWPTQVKYRYCKISHDVSKIISILNKILWKRMWKVQVWKITFFFHTNRPKKIFFHILFQTGKWQNFFPYF